MGGKIATLRQESFGGTLFFSDSTEIVYVNNDEYTKIKNKNIIGEYKKKLNGYDIRVLEQDFLPENSFSAPNKVFLELTRACNLRCLHCFNSSGNDIKDKLSFEDFKKIVKILSDKGIIEMRFTGGEPLVYAGIFELIRFASENNIYPSIGTNATLINEDIAKKLKDAGLRKAVVSVEGTEEVHNKMRGEGNFKKSVKAIENLKKNNIVVRVNSVLTRDNFEDVINLVKFTVDANIPIFIRRYINIGRGLSYDKNILSKNEYEKFKSKIEPYLKYDIVDGHYLKSRKVTKNNSKLPFTLDSCSAGQRGMVISPDGEVFSCGFLCASGEKSYGNMIKEKFEDIWKNVVNSELLSDLRKKRVNYNSQNEVQNTDCMAIVYNNY